MSLAALLLSHIFLCCHGAAQASTVLFHNLKMQKMPQTVYEDKTLSRTHV
jgi:hypothetical protein